MSRATLSETFPVSRISRSCNGCDGNIPAGARYRRWKGTMSDIAPGVLTYIECEGCCTRYGRPIYEALASTATQSEDA